MGNGRSFDAKSVAFRNPSTVCRNEEIARRRQLHVSRPVRWDSDHVVVVDDELKELSKEIIRNDADEKVIVALDYFDASINRIAAWAIGLRNFRKAMLIAMLTPHAEFTAMQNEGRLTELFLTQEELKS